MVDITASPLVSFLQQLKDPRIEHVNRRAWLDRLMLCVLATISGTNSIVTIAKFRKT